MFGWTLEMILWKWRNGEDLNFNINYFWNGISSVYHYHLSKHFGPLKLWFHFAFLNLTQIYVIKLCFSKWLLYALAGV